MALKIVKEVVRHFLNVQDRDVICGTRADATLAAVKQYRMSLIKELREAESMPDQQLAILWEEGLPSHVSTRDFLTTLRVLAVLDGR
ncbi:MAG: hypothetical protein JNK90_08415 [Planctomycetaceae bacterium]|nr:hypothetical protein [Planctomycetaceae bacterium]